MSDTAPAEGARGRGIAPSGAGTSPAVRAVWYWGPLVAYAGCIFWLSSQSRPWVPLVSLPGFDKVLHLGEYGVLGLLLCRALGAGGAGLSRRAALIAAVLVGGLYGATDELHQSFVPERDASLWDLAADVAGAVLGAALYLGVGRRRP